MKEVLLIGGRRGGSRKLVSLVFYPINGAAVLLCSQYSYAGCWASHMTAGLETAVIYMNVRLEISIEVYNQPAIQSISLPRETLIIS